MRTLEKICKDVLNHYILTFLSLNHLLSLGHCSAYFHKLLLEYCKNGVTIFPHENMIYNITHLPLSYRKPCFLLIDSRGKQFLFKEIQTDLENSVSFIRNENYRYAFLRKFWDNPEVKENPKQAFKNYPEWRNGRFLSVDEVGQDYLHTQVIPKIQNAHLNTAELSSLHDLILSGLISPKKSKNLTSIQLQNLCVCANLIRQRMVIQKQVLKLTSKITSAQLEIIKNPTIRKLIDNDNLTKKQSLYLTNTQFEALAFAFKNKNINEARTQEVKLVLENIPLYSLQYKIESPSNSFALICLSIATVITVLPMFTLLLFGITGPIYIITATVSIFAPYGILGLIVLALEAKKRVTHFFSEKRKANNLSLFTRPTPSNSSETVSRLPKPS